MDLDALLRRQESLVTRRQALRYMSEKALRHLHASGRWRRVHRAVVVTHTGPLTRSQRLWLAVLSAGCAGASACLGGVSALCAWGLRGIEADSIDILVRINDDSSRPSAYGFIEPAGRLSSMVDGI